MRSTSDLVLPDPTFPEHDQKAHIDTPNRCCAYYLMLEFFVFFCRLWIFRRGGLEDVMIFTFFFLLFTLHCV